MLRAARGTNGTVHMTQVAILGTGLIGASIGLGLRAHESTSDIEIVGFDASREREREAERRKAIDRRAGGLRRAVEGASLVVLSTPVLAIREVMEEIAPVLTAGTIVTDTCSTKAQVMRWADELLPNSINFVGSHPMAGKTQFGPAAAEATLFEGARWVIVPSRSASSSAVETVAGLATALGAKPMYMDAEEHDAYAAAISHLPMFAASALFRLVRDSEAWPEMSLLAASGFKDTTRLAGTDENMAHDIALTNREQLVHWLQRLRGAIHDLEDMVADPERDEDLLRHLAQLNLDHLAFEDGQIGRVEIDQKGAGLPDTSMSDLLLGGAISDRLRQMSDSDSEKREPDRRRFFGRR